MIAPLCLLVRLVSFVDVFVRGWFSLCVSADATHQRAPHMTQTRRCMHAARAPTDTPLRE